MRRNTVLFALFWWGLILSACTNPQPTTPTQTQPPPTQTQTEQTTVTPTQAPLPTDQTASETPPTAEAGEITYIVVAAESQACYRVREQLASLSFPNDAVGCTADIQGEVHLDVNQLIFQEGSSVRVNLSTLTSDQRRRDQYLRRNTLQTDRYPYATFVPKALEGVPTPLPEAGSINIRVRGDLTIREVTREVVWEGTAEFSGNRVTMHLNTAFTFDDFQLVRPRVGAVLSIEDPIRLEVTLVWEKLGE